MEDRLLEAARGGRQKQPELQRQCRHHVLLCLRGRMDDDLSLHDDDLLINVVEAEGHVQALLGECRQGPVHRVQKGALFAIVHKLRSAARSPTNDAASGISQVRMMFDAHHARNKYGVFHFLVACMDVQVLDSIAPCLLLIQALGVDPECLSTTSATESFPSMGEEKRLPLFGALHARNAHGETPCVMAAKQPQRLPLLRRLWQIGGHLADRDCAALSALARGCHCTALQELVRSYNVPIPSFVLQRAVYTGSVGLTWSNAVIACFRRDNDDEDACRRTRDLTVRCSGRACDSSPFDTIVALARRGSLECVQMLATCGASLRCLQPSEAEPSLDLSRDIRDWVAAFADAGPLAVAAACRMVDVCRGHLRAGGHRPFERHRLVYPSSAVQATACGVSLSAFQLAGTLHYPLSRPINTGIRKMFALSTGAYTGASHALSPRSVREVALPILLSLQRLADSRESLNLHHVFAILYQLRVWAHEAYHPASAA
ncbi:hypothetical protein PTSG_04503 [Salpingoeca rosetta]|uniref:Uncharacterized protein n=1 Tax=Salpingoeca rosetta (strain ATCC 50818 / BSB-021) TaxID=946362 RepID=F2U8R9_SALR5|nr:uncharacterized protein PTSG_04503 [Salpingoeca rosetta]EGD72777.1 hypothetical protein PTSG_04503 [Salpingoeca rosetta]|eukprot:XP_004994600.1 hypothetical protein PTSG_04503 [Salpingoeca rosetta]